jgi:LmbE family N-acetylglucosaminyl deacetylase
MIKHIIFFGLFLLSTISTNDCFASVKSNDGKDKLGFYNQEILPSISPQDRVLILAPHPDDEVIGCGGVIQNVIAAGAKIKVVLFTNGDNNEFVFIVNQKRVTFRKGVFIYMGNVRWNESLAALKTLGVNQQDVICLGYPDFGTESILTGYWGKTKPFRSMLARVTKVPYKQALSYGAPFVGESILGDLKKIIAAFKPTKIFISHPADSNRDHRALYVFSRIAIWDLADQLVAPDIFVYPVHFSGWPKPRGYKPHLYLKPPDKISAGIWQKLFLNSRQIEKKNKAINCFVSQIKHLPPYLFTFARRNEVFGDFPMIEVPLLAPEKFFLKNLAPAESIEQYFHGDNPDNRLSFTALTYSRQNDNFCLRLSLRHKFDKNMGITFWLLGYSQNTPFALMPKIRVNINLLGMKIFTQRKAIRIKNARMRWEGKTLAITLPLTALGNPDYLFIKSRTAKKNLSYRETAWRILKLD